MADDRDQSQQTEQPTQQAPGTGAPEASDTVKSTEVSHQSLAVSWPGGTLGNLPCSVIPPPLASPSCSTMVFMEEPDQMSVDGAGMV